MAIHRVKKPTEVGYDDDIFASTDMENAMPKYKMPEEEHALNHAYQIVHDELMLDGNSRLNLATFCGTWMDDGVQRIMAETLDKNMIDKDEYPQTAELELRCVHMLADLWNSPEEATTIGCSTTGSSEASMLGGMAMKWRWREKRRLQGKTTDKPNIVMGVDVQVCWHKFTRYWDIEERLIPMEKGRYIISPEEVVKRCDENTIGVVAIFGTTFTGQYEPVKEISNALDTLYQETGLDIPIHVDAASGGMVAPFIQKDIIWDFRVERVVSINASGHKYGLAPLGVGWVVWRDKKHLPDDLIFNVNYLGGEMPTFAINFSRPGGQICAQYYNFIRLGKEGYRKIQQGCQNVAFYLAEEILKLGSFEMVHSGTDLPLLCWKIKDGINLGYSLFDLSTQLRTYGWQVPAYSLPDNLNNVVVMRVVVRHGFSRDMASMLIDNIKKSIAFLEKHPLAESEIPDITGSFNHN